MNWHEAFDPADLKVTMRRTADDRWVVGIEHLPTSAYAESAPTGSALRAKEQALERLLKRLAQKEDNDDQD